MNPAAAEFARQILADEQATADYEVGSLLVPPEVAAEIDAALRRRHHDYHAIEDFWVARADG